MSVIIDTVFDDDYAAWSSFSVSPGTQTSPIPNVGIDGGFAATCQWNLQLSECWSTYAAAPSTFTMRCQAAFLDISGGSIAVTPFNIIEATDAQDVDCSGGTCGFNGSGLVNVESNGRLSVGIDDPSLGINVFFYSANDVFPHDGTYHGIQISLTFPTTHSVTYNLVVDDVSVVSGTYNTSGANNWTTCDDPPIPRARIRAAHLFVDRDNNNLCPLWLTGCAHAAIEDTVNIISYPPCNATTLTSTMCETCPPGQAVVTDISRGDCTDDIITVTGLYFTEPVSIDLQGPNGIAYVPDSVEVVSSTSIILHGPFVPELINGTYCITVTNV